ncbi:hypothetical protein MON38_07595 [Hymenobacter sp. DH14]|uniref:Lipoprotein n=1 Tax=Hymenobacter cyanobacteriorum TaxID=2926463 RepID=A0A9X1VHZ2_9BACT|nr:hypothetical protein [Hymenobacter cyanobacteriorum]MCI1187280.1 hypothetical protein [Hymenobacter cyanobacteriorum]
MRIPLPVVGALVLGMALAMALVGCEQKAYLTEKRASPVSVAVAPSAPPPAATPAPAPRPVAPAPAPVYRPGWAPPAVLDTAVVLNGRPYWLRIEAETDSTQRLKTTYQPYPGHYEQARGYQGHFTFALHDAAGQQLFRRQLRKADFYKAAGQDIVTESEAYRPELLAYSPAFGALVFTVDFMVPDSDVGSQAVLLLDLTGRVLRISDGRAPGSGADCDPALTPNGRALLTGSELLRPGQPALRLHRADADLAGAFLLTDTTMLVVYAPGKSRVIHAPGEPETYGRTPTKQQQQAANAQVRHLGTGRVLSRFRYAGFYEELGFTIPRGYVAGVHYLLDEQRGLRLVPAAAPARTTEVRFAAMPRFVPPQRRHEVRLELQSAGSGFAFYIDTTSQPPRIRYQRLEE